MALIPGTRLGVYQVIAQIGEGGMGQVYRATDTTLHSGGETGRSEVYVESYPAGGGKWQISTEGGSQAMWAPNGRELFYRIGNRMMVVDVESGTSFKANTPRVLFEMPLSESTPGDPSRYGVTLDAQRFLVLTPATDEKAAASIPPLTVVLNWTQALKR